MPESGPGRRRSAAQALHCTKSATSARTNLGLRATSSCGLIQYLRCVSRGDGATAGTLSRTDPSAPGSTRAAPARTASPPGANAASRGVRCTPRRRRGTGFRGRRCWPFLFFLTLCASFTLCELTCCASRRIDAGNRGLAVSGLVRAPCEWMPGSGWRLFAAKKQSKNRGKQREIKMLRRNRSQKRARVLDAGIAV